MGTCSNCGSNQVDEDVTNGYTICMGCGNVLEDQMIVSETAFSMESSGRKHLVGALVTDDGNVIGGGGLGIRMGAHPNYQRRIVEEATRIMFSIANRLKLTQQHIDSAVVFYKMALSKRLLQGKRKCHVCAACLYIVCRTENTPHILLDFSEIIKENMFQLVRVYTRLCNALCLKLPTADPCLFINRYTQRLQVGSKTGPISVTAMRLVSRMKRDWMATGRRPSSLCGAALVVACRLHGVNRQVSDIAKIVRNASSTISRRLKEFSETASSRLSIEEFESVDLGEEEDPPAFKASKEKHKLKEVYVEELQYELEKYRETLEKELEEANYGQIEGDDTSYLYKRPNYLPNCCRAKEDNSALSIAYGKIPNYVEGELLSGANNAEYPRCSIKTEKIKQESAESTLDTFSDVDDEEIDCFILTPQEVEIKEKRWAENDFDEFLAEKAKKKAEKEEEERRKPKRKYRRTQKSTEVSKTPAEAMEKMIKEKKLSSKINYDVLKDLGKQSDATIARIRKDTETEPGVKQERVDSEDARYDEEDDKKDLLSGITRKRSNTITSNDSFEEYADEEEYLDYSEGLALSDAIKSYDTDG